MNKEKKKPECPFKFKYQRIGTKTNEHGIVVPITIGKPYIACGIARKLAKDYQPIIMKCVGGDNCPVHGEKHLHGLACIEGIVHNQYKNKLITAEEAIEEIIKILLIS